MKKIPTIFKINPERMNEVIPEQNPACEWVFYGEGVATRKYDGTCCRIKDGQLWKRRELKQGVRQPEGFEIADFDEVTGKTVGWMPVTDCKEDIWHIEAFGDGNWPDGTYELCGPKVQGNPEMLGRHMLISHKDASQYDYVARDFDSIKEFLERLNIEGLVFHHPDGRMAKIKKRDFGMRRS